MDNVRKDRQGLDFLFAHFVHSNGIKHKIVCFIEIALSAFIKPLILKAVDTIG